MIDGRRRALPADRRLPCARRSAERPRANAPHSRRSRRSAAFAPPAETRPFGRECYPYGSPSAAPVFLSALPRRALRRVPRRALPSRARRAGKGVLHSRRVEGGAPALLVVPRELKVIVLARHADGDVADTTSPFGAEATVEIHNRDECEDRGVCGHGTVTRRNDP